MALSTTAERLSGMTVENTPPKKAQAASQPSMTASVVWAKVIHTKQCRLKQAVKISEWAASPLGQRVIERARAPEADLAFITGPAVGHSHRRPSAPTAATDLQGAAVQRPLGHDHALAAEQVVALDHGETCVQPGLDLVVVGHQDVPGLAPAVDAMRPNNLDTEPIRALSR